MAAGAMILAAFARCTRADSKQVNTSPPLTQRASHDLWFAGLHYDGKLYPAAAFIDGKRWDGWPEQVFSSDVLPDSIASIP
jgi:hypothetical protein